MNKTLQAALLEMKKEDLNYRDYLPKNKSLYEGYDKKMESIPFQNAERLNEIIHAHGWPGRTLVGKEGGDAALLIAQHSISSP